MRPKYSKLTRDEKKILDALGECASLLKDLPAVHDAEISEFVLNIHAAQVIILARAAYTRKVRE